jgi:hypothetical protein
MGLEATTIGFALRDLFNYKVAGIGTVANLFLCYNERRIISKNAPKRKKTYSSFYFDAGFILGGVSGSVLGSTLNLEPYQFS